MKLNAARSLIQAAQARAMELGILVAVCVVDAGGNTVAFERMNDAQLTSSRIAEGKAYTTLAWQRPSGALWQTPSPAPAASASTRSTAASSYPRAACP